MYPFVWSAGGGSQESAIVFELNEMTERLLGGALGAMYRQKNQFNLHAVDSVREIL